MFFSCVCVQELSGCTACFLKQFVLGKAFLYLAAKACIAFFVWVATLYIAHCRVGSYSVRENRSCARVVWELRLFMNSMVVIVVATDKGVS